MWPAVTFPQPGLAEGHGVLTLGGLRPMHHADGTPLTAHELHNQTNVLVHHPDGTQQTVNELLAQMRRLDRPASDPGSDSGVEVISVADDELDADVEVCVASDGHSQARNAFGKRYSSDNTGDGPTDGSSPPRFRPARDAARNNAVGPSGAGPSGGMEIGPSAAHAPKHGIEITQTSASVPPAGAPASASDAPTSGTPAPAALNVVPAHARVERIRTGLFQLLPPPRTQADLSSVRHHEQPPTSEQPAAAPNTQRGSTPLSRAKLTAPSPAEGNDAAGPSDAGQSDSVEAGPPATHALARDIETKKKPNNEPQG